VRACVIHNTLNSVGGGERVCLSVIEVLKSMGFNVTLITAEPTNWNYVEEIVGYTVRPDREISVLPFKVRLFSIYTRLLTFLKLKGIRGRYDLTVNTHGDILPIPLDIVYMHYPTFILLKENPVNVKYSKSIFWRAYFTPYEKLQNNLTDKIKHSIVITNSEYSREAIKRYLGVNAIVIHPPIDIERFLKASENKVREKRVILCGRYTPEKNFEFALIVARELPHVEFTIIGATSGKVSSTYYTKLCRLRDKLNVRNVKLLRDVPLAEQINLYAKSRVFMHTMVGEHFGIAVVEGMAAGLVPVVHRSGGPWLDILNRGRYGLGYSNLSEAVEAVEKAIREYNYYSTRAVERARMYSKSRFTKAFTMVVEKVVNI